LHREQSASGAWSYLCGVPIAKESIGEWGSWFETDEEAFALIGTTSDSDVDVKNGVLSIEASELFYRELSPKKLRWLGPTKVMGTTDEPPTTVESVIAMLKPDETKFQKTYRLIKLSGIEPEDLHLALEPVHEAEGFTLENDNPLAKSGEQRVALGVVLEPEETDSQKDIYSSKEVRLAAERFGGTIGFMHQTALSSAELLGSYIARRAFGINGEPVKRGTWLALIKFNDAKLWDKIKCGEFTGLSIGGTAIKEPANP
jgi:hypothetical protein